MSGKRSRRQRDPSQPDETSLWMASEPALDGTYIVAFNWGDRAWARTPAECLTYCLNVVTIANRADHDAAVIKQLAALGLPAMEAARLVVDIRADRPEIILDGPLQLEGGVSSDGEFRPFIALVMDGEKVGQWDVQQAADHATGVLSVVATADLDQAYLRTLTGVVGLPDGTARAAVGALGQYRVLD